MKYKRVMYDPPSGWQFGFPKVYRPLPGETLEDTLRRDGYPERELAQGMAEHVRFWETEAGQFCLQCGAGMGTYRREGEGTCPKCEKVGI